MKKIVSALFALIASVILLSSCVPPSGDPNNSGNNNGGNNSSLKYTILKGTIKTATTLEAGKTYYIDSQVYIDGCDLNVNGEEDNKVIVKFGPSGSLTIKNKAGIIAENAVFTSAKEDIGEKIEGISSTEPLPGDWKYININGGRGIFLHCRFSYGGSDSQYSTVIIKKYSTAGRAFFDDCKFTNNGGTDSLTSKTAALSWTKDCAYDSGTNNITNSYFDGNIWPMVIPADWEINNSNTITENNKYRGISITDGYIKGSAFWAHQEFPYYVVRGTTAITIDKTGSLQIEGGEKDSETKVLFAANKIQMTGKTSNLYIEENTILDSYNSENKWKGIIQTMGGYTRYYLENTDKNIQMLNRENYPSTAKHFIKLGNTEEEPTE
ncbi:MAG: hypothetical protein MJ162_08355 [Treponema sp.]|nr:hypothetical protein [Treponema sp.]